MLAALITKDKVRDRDHLLGEVFIQPQGFENPQPQIAFEAEAIALRATRQALIALVHVHLGFGGEALHCCCEGESADTSSNDRDFHRWLPPYMLIFFQTP